MEDLNPRPLVGSGGWTRTSDLRLMRPAPYQLGYPAIGDLAGFEPAHDGSTIRRLDRSPIGLIYILAQNDLRV